MLVLTASKQRSSAFTLAELLLVMTIIGIIASYTIPTLLINIQDAELRASQKHMYSVVDQAARRLMIDNGSTLNGLFTSHDQVKDQFKTHLNYIKECANNAAYGVCFVNDSDSKRLDGNSGSGYYDNRPSLVLNNGSQLLFYYLSNSCTHSGYGPLVCGLILVDVNGMKGPNTFGRDIYGVYIRDFGIQPEGIQGDVFENTCSRSSTGIGCIAKFLRNYNLP